jgi:hypothetical protein
MSPDTDEVYINADDRSSRLDPVLYHDFTYDDNLGDDSPIDPNSAGDGDDDAITNEE